MDSDPEFTVDEGEDMSAIAEEKLFSVIGSYSESIEEDSIYTVGQVHVDSVPVEMQHENQPVHPTQVDV